MEKEEVGKRSEEERRFAIRTGLYLIDEESGRRIGASSGVPEIWYVDPRTDSAEVLRLGADGSYAAAGAFSRDQTLVSPTFPGFELPLSRRFA